MTVSGPNGSFKGHKQSPAQRNYNLGHKTYDTSDVFVMKWRENAVNKCWEQPGDLSEIGREMELARRQQTVRGEDEI